MVRQLAREPPEATTVSSLSPTRDDAVRALESLLVSYDPNVRLAALTALISLAEATATMVACLADPDVGVARKADEYFRFVAFRRAGLLLAVASDVRARARLRALDLFLTTPAAASPDAADALATLVADPEPMVRERAAPALARLGDPRALAALLVQAATSHEAGPLVELAVAILDRRAPAIDDATLAAAEALACPRQFVLVEDEDRGGHLPQTREEARPDVDLSGLRRRASEERARRQAVPAAVPARRGDR
jgi:HEAT repeat protein